ncbi:MAG: PEP-CTERM sorting domain-containing protein [Akkermansiaceae bacterium]
MKKTIFATILASAISAHAATVVTAVLTYSGGAGTISSGGVQVGTFTFAADDVIVSTTSADTLIVEHNIANGSADFQFVVTMTDADFSITGNDWFSTSIAPDGGTAAVGGRNTTIDISANSGTGYAIGQANWAYDGVATTGATSGTYTAGDIITSELTSSATTPLTTDDMWSITGADGDSILTVAKNGPNSAGRENFGLTIELTQVPEPSSAALLGLGGLALLIRRRR